MLAWWILWQIMPFGPLSSGFWAFRRGGWVRAALRTLPTRGWLHGLHEPSTAVPLSGFGRFLDNSIILFGLLGVPPAPLIKAPPCFLVLKCPHRLINHKSSKGYALDFQGKLQTAPEEEKKREGGGSLIISWSWAHHSRWKCLYSFIWVVSLFKSQ